MKILFIVIGIILMIFTMIKIGNLLYLFKRIKHNWKHNKERTTTYPKFSAKQFQRFVELCPSKWNWSDSDKMLADHSYVDPPCYLHNHAIWFTDQIEMYKAWKWYANFCNNKQNIEEYKATAEFIELMNKEILNAQKTADEMMITSEKQLKEILERIDKMRVQGGH